MRPRSKTPDGLHVFASQRYDTEQPVRVEYATLSAARSGSLVIEASVGNNRGTHVKAIVRLEELLAWLPELADLAQKHAVEKAAQERPR